jgi:hypothetical protein
VLCYSLAQDKREMPPVGEDEAEISLVRKTGQFREISSVEGSVDPGNKIVAIRRLTLIVDDYDSNQDPINERSTMSRSNSSSEIAPPALN